MYKEYNNLSNNGISQISSLLNSQVADIEVDSNDVDLYRLYSLQYKKLMRKEETIKKRTKVDRYLIEQCVDVDDPNFDILTWKTNSSRFKILSMIARDVLVIPVSTVASFSTGGHVVDPFRSSLTPKTIKALICTQNWLRSTPIVYIRSCLEEIEYLESDIEESRGLTILEGSLELVVVLYFFFQR
ncbi:LOW QUALITY PROTEIN: HAT, C-terminal dimerization domain containing protein [Parasponia andersonii]|uniref:HAT, C-terminal dimerization domain containing protein n=1 Tax=Parasponia andersonii TaxID=3476 RepID=A0A2P5A5G9_PARAD|nr:LOW QUALITY PROTEIN: HAT, C-terminal dimerization domain containing protein [Parasponia andersonii]